MNDLSTLINTYGNFNKTEKTVFLANFLHGLTVIVRSVIYDMRQDPKIPLAPIQACNEIMHQLSSQITDIQKGRDGWPDDLLFSTMLEQAGNGKIRSLIERDLQRVLAITINRNLKS